VHYHKHLPGLVRQPVARQWVPTAAWPKGGDYFGVAAERSNELCDIPA
jgi:hypothetical protein